MSIAQSSLIVDPGQVAGAISRAYGMDLTCEFVIDGEQFLSIALTELNGNRFIAKVRQSPFPEGEIHWQQMLLDSLHAPAFEYQVPRLVRDEQDRAVSTLVIGEPSQSVEVMLLSWVDGELMATLTSPSPELLFDVGRLSASLTQRIGSLDVAFAHRDHHWVLARSLKSLDESLSAAAKAANGQVVDEIIAFFNRYCSGLGQLPQATVHQDLNPHNITVNLACPDHVHGVIDFNDAVRTARVTDLAIASAYSMFGQSDPMVAIATTVNGYQSVSELENDEKSVLLPLAMIRLLVNWASWSKLSNGDAASYAASRMQHTYPVIQKVTELGLENCRQQLLELIR